jgi:hypothetical protein
VTTVINVRETARRSRPKNGAMQPSEDSQSRGPGAETVLNPLRAVAPTADDGPVSLSAIGLRVYSAGCEARAFVTENLRIAQRKRVDITEYSC